MTALLGDALPFLAGVAVGSGWVMWHDLTRRRCYRLDHRPDDDDRPLRLVR